MANYNPKRTANKLQKVVDAWQTIRPAKQFAGMTLEQFKAKVQPSLDTRGQLVDLHNQATDSRTLRRQADAASLELAQLVVNGVKADAEEGENGSLYAAMGYVPKSARRSGLTRKGSTALPVTDAVAKAPTA
jgi:hypothetical protein